MAQTAIRMTTRVLPGRRIQVTAPELAEGEDVELIVLRPEGAPTQEEPQGVWDWLQSLTPVPRTAEEWAVIERELQEERESWSWPAERLAEPGR